MAGEEDKGGGNAHPGLQLGARRVTDLGTRASQWHALGSAPLPKKNCSEQKSTKKHLIRRGTVSQHSALLAHCPLLVEIRWARESSLQVGSRWGSGPLAPGAFAPAASPAVWLYTRKPA